MRWPLVFVLLFVAAVGCSPNDAVPETAIGDNAKQRAIDPGTVINRADVTRVLRDPEKDVAPTQDTGSTYAYNSCTEVFACSQASCGSSAVEGCETACTSKSKPEAAAGMADYIDCMDAVCRGTVCAPDKGAACLAQCAAQRCTPMLLPCFSSGKTGSNGCSVLFQAQDGCAKAQDSFKCLAGGYDTLKTDQQVAWIQMRKCLAKSTATDQWNDCLSVVLACAADGKVGPKPCRDVVACDAACGTTTHLYLCMGKCVASGTADAQSNFLSVRKCLYQVQSENSDDGACFSSVGTCAEPAGKATCAQTWDCTNKCKGETGNAELYCATACLHAASQPASETFTAWWGCREGVCKPKCESDKTCLLGCYQKSCGTLSKACLKP